MLNPFTNRKILKRGERALATIVAMPSLEAHTRPSNVQMILRVDPGEGAPFEVRDRWMVAANEKLAPGDELWVAIDPDNRHRVVIDWEQTRAELNPHHRVISRVTEPGIPQPVDKVRAAVEEADPGHFARLHPPRPVAVPEPVDEPADHFESDFSPAPEPPVATLDAPRAGAGGAETLTDSLERLAALHAAGALTDGEFAAAKRHVLVED